MRETPSIRNRPGQVLTAKTVNELSRIARRDSLPFPGTGQVGISATFNGQCNVNPFTIETLEIVSPVAGTTGVYYARMRYYSHTDDEWKENTDTGLFFLDGRELGATFPVGAKVVAFWHPQRLAFIPMQSSNSQVLKVGKADTDFIAPLDTGNVKVWRDGEETDEVLEDVVFDWITNDQDIVEGTEVIVAWFPDEGDGGIWRIIGASCS